MYYNNEKCLITVLKTLSCSENIITNQETLSLIYPFAILWGIVGNSSYLQGMVRSPRTNRERGCEIFYKNGGVDNRGDSMKKVEMPDFFFYCLSTSWYDYQALMKKNFHLKSSKNTGVTWWVFALLKLWSALFQN